MSSLPHGLHALLLKSSQRRLPLRFVLNVLPSTLCMSDTRVLALFSDGPLSSVAVRLAEEEEAGLGRDRVLRGAESAPCVRSGNGPPPAKSETSWWPRSALHTGQ